MRNRVTTHGRQGRVDNHNLDGVYMPCRVGPQNRYQGAAEGLPQITIQRRGTLAINCAAFELLGSPPAVELLFDVERRILGMRTIAATAINAYAVRGIDKPPRLYLITGIAFTEYHDIATDIARRWYAELHEDILSIDLTTPGAELGAPREDLVRDRGLTKVARWRCTH